MVGKLKVNEGRNSKQSNHNCSNEVKKKKWDVIDAKPSRKKN